ncbi:MAG: hypothetical protein COC05_00745 [Gammaproteobacteria bacterium]|nr:MAG: hypothetical protein COC05_00745 [Gammaproteobacteria bacterium]
MKQNDVPQDHIKTLGGLRKAMYATDEQGNYTVVPSDGWEAEELVLNQAIEEFERQTDEALARCRSNISSPLEYHMYHCRMDQIVLAQSTGFFKWQVKRHLKPAHFCRLSAKKLARYSEALGLSIDQLKSLPDE